MRGTHTKDSTAPTVTHVETWDCLSWCNRPNCPMTATPDCPTECTPVTERLYRPLTGTQDCIQFLQKR